MKEATIKVDKDGISFAGKCWVSHTKIMEHSGQIFKNNYMDFVSETLGEDETPFKLNEAK